MSFEHLGEPTQGPRLLFTEPWDPIVVRRGDALGLLALTSVFAEMVAPGLTNRVRCRKLAHSADDLRAHEQKLQQVLRLLTREGSRGREDRRSGSRADEFED